MTQSLDLSQTNIVPSEHPELFNSIQGNILAGHGRDFSRHIFLTFSAGQADTARTWLRDYAATQVTSAAEQENQRAQHINGSDSESLFSNVFLSTWAYSYFGYDDLTQQPADDSFRQGMATRTTVLSDPERSLWEQDFQSNIHIMVLVAHNTESQAVQACQNILDATSAFTQSSHIQEGAVIRNDTGQVIEHFGFADGVTNPQYLKRKIDSQPSAKFDTSAPLSLVLAKDPQGDEWAYGSFVVYRKLAQDVPAWNSAVMTLANTLDVDPSLAGAYAVGRFQDGTPVVDSKTALGGPVNSDFNYDDDPEGAKCPFHAHTRKTNPRGQTEKLFAGTSLESERHHRITRRAISYGNQGSSDVGLLFLCMQSSIVDQFDFMQRSWANANHFIKNNTGQDTVIGQGGQYPEEGQAYPNEWGNEEAGTTRFDFKHFISMRGGEYFFAPSMAFIKNI